MSDFMDAIEAQTEGFDPARQMMLRLIAKDWEDLHKLARDNIELLQGGELTLDEQKKVQTLVHQQVGEYKSLSVQMFRLLDGTGAAENEFKTWMREGR